MAIEDIIAAIQGTPEADAYASAAPADVAAAPSGKLGLGQEIFKYFKAKGLSDDQAAAIAGNMAWESGGSASNVTAGDNIRNSPRSPHSVGIGQWNDRAPALLEFARSKGVDVPEGSTSSASYMRDAIKRIPLQTQLDFAYSEMQGPERRAFGMVKDAGNLDDALKGGISYHRPAGWTWANPANGHGFAERQGIAKQILASSAPAGSPAATVADRFGSWSPDGTGTSPAVDVPAAPGSEPVRTAAAPASPMSGLFDTLKGNDPVTKGLQASIGQADQKQEAANQAAAADPVLKVPLKQADLRSVLELIQRMSARGPLGTMGA